MSTPIHTIHDGMCCLHAHTLTQPYITALLHPHIQAHTHSLTQYTHSDMHAHTRMYIMSCFKWPELPSITTLIWHDRWYILWSTLVFQIQPDTWYASVTLQITFISESVKVTADECDCRVTIHQIVWNYLKPLASVHKPIMTALPIATQAFTNASENSHVNAPAHCATCLGLSRHDMDLKVELGYL